MHQCIVACDEHAKEQEQDRSRSDSRSLDEEEEHAMEHTTWAIGRGDEQERSGVVVAIASPAVELDGSMRHQVWSARQLFLPPPPVMCSRPRRRTRRADGGGAVLPAWQ